MRYLVGVIIVLFSLGAYAEEMEQKPEMFCPKTKISDNDKCFECHAKPDFKLKEAAPDRLMNLPTGARYIEGKLYYIVDIMSADYIQRLFEYVRWHPEIRHVIMEVHSPGGSLLDAWKIIGLMSEAESQGIIVETRCYGFAASAGFLVFVGGTIGHRYCNPNAEFMHHELWTFRFFDLSSPSKKENEAEVLRHLQDTVHEWLVTRATKPITKDQLDDLVKFKDYWMRGREVIELGFADGEIGKNAHDI